MPTPVPPYLTQTPNTTGTATYSIQKRLLTSLLLGLPLLWLIVTSISVWRLAHEINEINEKQNPNEFLRIRDNLEYEIKFYEERKI